MAYVTKATTSGGRNGRAVLEGGVRTSTLRAVTKCRVAAAQGDQLDRKVLEEISQGHRHESSG